MGRGARAGLFARWVARCVAWGWEGEVAAAAVSRYVHCVWSW